MSRLRPSITNENAVLDLVDQELSIAAPDAVQAIAKQAITNHGDAVLGVLFYGSALRDTDLRDTLVDLYLIVDRYARAHANSCSGWFNALLPPNVYYVECDHLCDRIRAKYAVVSLRHLERMVSPTTFNPYFWARFAQPTGLLCCDAREVRQRINGVMVQAITTMMTKAAPMISAGGNARTFWIDAFGLTYATELRAEKPHRSIQIYERFAARYDRLIELLHPELSVEYSDGKRPFRARLAWWLRRRQGKLLSVLRLLKAAFTFNGGADYLVWKITRHSGVEIEITDWQRRHPILAAPPLLWRLRRQRAVR